MFNDTKRCAVSLRQLSFLYDVERALYAIGKSRSRPWGKGRDDAGGEGKRGVKGRGQKGGVRKERGMEKNSPKMQQFGSTGNVPGGPLRVIHSGKLFSRSTFPSLIVPVCLYFEPFICY